MHFEQVPLEQLKEKISLEALSDGAPTAPREESWMRVCGRAAVEQDPEKLLTLVNEVNRLLDEDEWPLHQSGEFGGIKPSPQKGWKSLWRKLSIHYSLIDVHGWEPGLSWHLADGRMGGTPMANHHAVALRVAPFLRIECKFWLTDDGWNGSCEQLSITVRAGSFEFAKSEMEIALGKHFESLLREAQRTTTGHAA
jgi:hypothetical protein